MHSMTVIRDSGAKLFGNKSNEGETHTHISSIFSDQKMILPSSQNDCAIGQEKIAIALFELYEVVAAP